MTDDALLVLGAYTGDAAYLQRILAEYPGGDTIAKAKGLVKELEHPYYRPPYTYGYPLPFKIVSLDDKAIPQEIKEWAAPTFCSLLPARDPGRIELSACRRRGETYGLQCGSYQCLR